jgi:hypothetical protein
MKYKLKRYPILQEVDTLLLDFEDVYQGYEVVAMSITGWFRKTLWIIYKSKSEFTTNSEEVDE